MTYVIGEALAVLRGLEADRFQCCVTSPPYWGLRDYGHPEQLGLEATPSEYIARLVTIMREVRRVLRPDGVLWLNLGDCYAGSGRGGYAGGQSTLDGSTQGQDRSRAAREAMSPPSAGFHDDAVFAGVTGRRWVKPPEGLKPKDLVGIPWMAAFALRADGWWLRQDNVWSKPSPMPDPTSDRTTRAHEYVFQLARSYDYFYDAAAIAEDAVSDRSGNRGKKSRKSRAAHGGIKDDSRHQTTGVPWVNVTGKRNRRSVWSIASQPYGGAHFAVMPPDLAQTCILASSRIGDEVLDPFLGSGTVGMVAESLGRRWFGIDVQPNYEPMIKERTAQVGLFARREPPPGGDIDTPPDRDRQALLLPHTEADS